MSCMKYPSEKTLLYHNANKFYNLTSYIVEFICFSVYRVRKRERDSEWWRTGRKEDPHANNGGNDGGRIREARESHANDGTKTKQT